LSAANVTKIVVCETFPGRFFQLLLIDYDLSAISITVRPWLSPRSG